MKEQDFHCIGRELIIRWGVLIIKKTTGKLLNNVVAQGRDCDGVGGIITRWKRGKVIH